MFERFTEQARQVVVLAREEARELRHNHIGTEHILLGLLREEDGLAARVLAGLDVTLEAVRGRIVGPAVEVTTSRIAFTPRVKKVFEVALRESLGLGTTTSAPSTSCSGSRAKTRGRQRGSC